ncbi:cytochrome P450 [Streptomyces sp. NPDC058701]|uniref:cytochrome P450 n=1 Tax=Streptomyces sp. NPDC058701 TaxID=3346608 RepID=UPI00364CDB09
MASKDFTPAAAERFRHRTREIAAGLIAGMPRGEGFDVMDAYARPLTFTVLREVMGIAAHHHDGLYRWMCTLDAGSGDPVAVTAALDHVEDLVRTELRRRQAPEAGLLASIAAAAQSSDATEDEAVSLCTMVLIAGFGVTTQMVGVCLLGLLTQESVLSAVLENPSLLPETVEELIRKDTSAPFTTVRRAVADMVIGDTSIPAGDDVLLSLGGANRDPRAFGPAGLHASGSRRSRHLAFGHGPHYCLGAPLARMELTTALGELLRLHPELSLAVEPSELAWRGGYQHRVLDKLPVLLGPGPAVTP